MEQQTVSQNQNQVLNQQNPVNENIRNQESERALDSFDMSAFADLLSAVGLGDGSGDGAGADGRFGGMLSSLRDDSSASGRLQLTELPTDVLELVAQHIGNNGLSALLQAVQERVDYGMKYGDGGGSGAGTGSGSGAGAGGFGLFGLAGGAFRSSANTDGLHVNLIHVGEPKLLRTLNK